MATGTVWYAINLRNFCKVFLNHQTNTDWSRCSILKTTTGSLHSTNALCTFALVTDQELRCCALLQRHLSVASCSPQLVLVALCAGVPDRESMFGCFQCIRRSERVQQYFASYYVLRCTAVVWTKIFALQGRRSDGEQQSVPAFRLQIGTGAHTFDKFLDNLPLCREITILLMLNILSSVNID